MTILRRPPSPLPHGSIGRGRDAITNCSNFNIILSGALCLLSFVYTNMSTISGKIEPSYMFQRQIATLREGSLEE